MSPSVYSAFVSGTRKVASVLEVLEMSSAAAAAAASSRLVCVDDLIVMMMLECDRDIAAEPSFLL